MGLGRTELVESTSRIFLCRKGTSISHLHRSLNQSNTEDACSKKGSTSGPVKAKDKKGNGECHGRAGQARAQTTGWSGGGKELKTTHPYQGALMSSRQRSDRCWERLMAAMEARDAAAGIQLQPRKRPHNGF